MRKHFHHVRRALNDLLHPPPAPQPSHTSSLATLLPLLDRAVFLQPQAEQVIQECAAPGKPAEDLAQRGNAVVVGYWKLRRDLLPIEVSVVDRPVKERIRSLLLYHEWSVHEAVDCACSPQQTGKMRIARAQMRGLGAPGTRLRELRQDLSAEYAALTGPGSDQEENGGPAACRPSQAP
ncbi:hypothetical protein ABZ890_43305 [Streptomyces sp. NPDC046984]|uniref:hypothetical protein n=1 Tax=Streptomyces sp. NPDC046984 TaxID=3155138 RepID=UPI0033C2AF49